MTNTPTGTSRWILNATKAADLMSPHVVSIRADATVSEALAAMTQRGFNAAPVIEESGRPVGVVSRADILIHNREQPANPPSPNSTRAETENPTRVRDIMTPAVFSVTAETEAGRVIEQIRTFNVHQLFVVDGSHSVVGVISTLDVLRRLSSE